MEAKISIDRHVADRALKYAAMSEQEFQALKDKRCGPASATTGRDGSTIAEPGQSPMRNAADVGVNRRRPNHCHDCGVSLPTDVYVERRPVPWRAKGCGPDAIIVITGDEPVPLCQDCATGGCRTTDASICRGCGRKTHGARWCSSRCWQRLCRLVKRLDREMFCETCGIDFRGKRRDARFCSTRCRMRAMRARLRQRSPAGDYAAFMRARRAEHEDE